MRCRALALTVLVLLLAGSGSLWLVADGLTKPAPRLIGPAPADLGAIDVRIPLATGGLVAGWYATGQAGAGAVLLLHGVRSDRRQMLSRARFLSAAGHAVMLIDLPAHGESGGDRITFGWQEAKGVEGALDELRRRSPGERIGVIGASLGGAAALFVHPPRQPDALVLEAVFPTIEEAASNRLKQRLGALESVVTPMLMRLLPLRIGVDASALRPIDAIARRDVPVLVASGTLDAHTTWPQTQRLFAAARQAGLLWAVEGAGHVDLHDFDPAAYREHILPFFARHLRRKT